MIRKILTLLCSALPITGNATQETQFWNWFIENESALFSFLSPTDPLLDDLNHQLAQVNADLTFEFSLVFQDGRREFVISANGLKEAFPAVEALYAAAPTLKRWDIIKYRPRRNPVHTLSIGDREFDPSKVNCLLVKDGVKIGIVIMYDDYEPENNLFGQASYLLLDEALGEYAVEMQVGFVDIRSREDKWIAQSFPLTELASEFDAAKMRLAGQIE
ncbi:hypothetical protein F471_03952 [Pseudomonas sp. URMO17WK12:I1]|uniref:hypothetical protein n=1 Tax=unclassified Pseudomonas TaxID=196821 RepID=UPI000684F234|nr:MULTISPECIES: hypothetical protein [unclassified Pseudomonas]PZW64431.1 hypothetical protein F471_03952 [Pseudomonas sp. URMO17WK12:I1]